jgi:uncharacterized membrane protein
MTTIERTRPQTPQTRRRRTLRQRLAVPALVVLALACLQIVVVVAPYLSFDPDVYFEEQRATYVRMELVLGVHVLCGILALLTGLLQFVRPLRRRLVRVHRVLGAVYVASATGLGVTGLILARTAYTGLSASLAFSLLGLATLYATWTALRMVMSGRYGEHGRWMIRSFSLILAGVALRLWVPLYLGLHRAGLVGFSFATAYATIAWLCWVPNLLIALWMTRRAADPALAP